MSQLCDKNVRRFNIAVDDSGGMRRREGVGNLNTQVEQLIERQRFVCNECLSVWPSRNSMRDEAMAFLFASRKRCKYSG